MLISGCIFIFTSGITRIIHQEESVMEFMVMLLRELWWLTLLLVKWCFSHCQSVQFVSSYCILVSLSNWITVEERLRFHISILSNPMPFTIVISNIISLNTFLCGIICLEHWSWTKSVTINSKMQPVEILYIIILFETLEEGRKTFQSEWGQRATQIAKEI